MKLSISTRLVLLVALLVTATAATISYYLYKSGVVILTEHALRDQSQNLQRDGDRLSSHIDELKRDVLFLSNSPPIPGSCVRRTIRAMTRSVSPTPSYGNSD